MRLKPHTHTLLDSIRSRKLVIPDKLTRGYTTFCDCSCAGLVATNRRMGADHLLLAVVLAIVCCVQSSSAGTTIPAKVVDGICPSEEQQVTIRQQIMNEVVAILTPGFTEGNPASSCLQLSLVNSSFPSGYYWVRVSNGSAVRVYCDMTRSCGGVTGGWTRVAFLQFQSGSDPCPDGFRERNDSGIRTCGVDSTTAACPSVLFDTHGIPYIQQSVWQDTGLSIQHTRCFC